MTEQEYMKFVQNFLDSLYKLFGLKPKPYQILGGLKFMYIVADDNPDVNYSVDTSDVQVKDAEGNVIPDEQLTIDVVSDNPAAVSLTPGADGKSGTASFGSPGDAAVTATIKDAKSDTVFAVLGAQFHVTTGNPASITGGKLSFEGLTEQS